MRNPSAVFASIVNSEVIFRVLALRVPLSLVCSARSLWMIQRLPTGGLNAGSTQSAAAADIARVKPQAIRPARRTIGNFAFDGIRPPARTGRESRKRPASFTVRTRKSRQSLRRTSDRIEEKGQIAGPIVANLQRRRGKSFPLAVYPRPAIVNA